MDEEKNKSREKFEQNGFFVFENILDAQLIKRLRCFTEKILDETDSEHFESHLSTGSMVLINWDMAYQFDVLTELIAHPGALVALKKLGFESPKFGHGRIISKPPQSPPLFWHEDGRFWNDPVSYTKQPIQCFLMYYLTDTTRINGCLRLIPGSHLNRHSILEKIESHHTNENRKYEKPNAPEFSHLEDEIDVSVKAGDLVMGYGSLLHAAHANQTDNRRTCLTMWYYPDFVSLPERTQATVKKAEVGHSFSTDGEDAADLDKDLIKRQTLLKPLKIVYNGDAKPIPLNTVRG